MSDEFKRFRMARPCPKCGSGPTPSRACSQRSPGSVLTGDLFHPYVPEGDHLHRACLHCGYERIELAMDTPLMSAERRETVTARLSAERNEWISRTYRRAG